MDIKKVSKFFNNLDIVIKENDNGYNLDELLDSFDFTDMNTSQIYYFKKGYRNYIFSKTTFLNISEDVIRKLNDKDKYDFNIGQILIESGNLGLSLEYFTSLKNITNNKDALELIKFAQAELNRMLGQYKVALTYYSEMTTSKNYLKDLHGLRLKGMASVFKVTDQFTNALEHLNELIEIFETNYRYYFSRGHLHQHNSSPINPEAYKLAQEDYEKSLEYKKWEVTYFHLALVYGHLGEYNKMEDKLVKSISGFTKNKSYNNDINLALAYIIAGRVYEGVNIAKDSLAFLNIHQLECSKKNVGGILENKIFKSYLLNQKNGLEEYESLCKDRIKELNEGSRIFGRFSTTPYKVNSEIIPACIGFIDVRGFTKHTFQMGMESYVSIAKLAQELYLLCLNHLQECTTFVKFQGDGVMFVSRIWGNSKNSIEEAMEIIISALLNIQTDFRFKIQKQNKDLELGFGITLGNIVELELDTNNKDYIGHRINLVAKLCDLARPYGIYICTDKNIIDNKILEESLNSAIKRFDNKFEKSEEKNIKGIDDSIEIYIQKEN